MEGSGPKRDLLSFYRELCLERGASLSVGPAHYRWFVELTDDEMKEIVRLILHDRAKDIKRWTDAFPQMKSEQDIFDYIERFHNPRRRRQLEEAKQRGLLLTQPSVEMG